MYSTSYIISSGKSSRFLENEAIPDEIDKRQNKSTGEPCGAACEKSICGCAMHPRISGNPISHHATHLAGGTTSIKPSPISLASEKIKQATLRVEASDSRIDFCGKPIVEPRNIGRPTRTAEDDAVIEEFTNKLAESSLAPDEFDLEEEIVIEKFINRSANQSLYRCRKPVGIPQLPSSLFSSQEYFPDSNESSGTRERWFENLEKKQNVLRERCRPTGYSPSDFPEASHIQSDFILEVYGAQMPETMNLGILRPLTPTFSFCDVTKPPPIAQSLLSSTGQSLSSLRTRGGHRLVINDAWNRPVSEDLIYAVPTWSPFLSDGQEARNTAMSAPLEVTRDTRLCPSFIRPLMSDGATSIRDFRILSQSTSFSSAESERSDLRGRCQIKDPLALAKEHLTSPVLGGAGRRCLGRISRRTGVPNHPVGFSRRGEPRYSKVDVLEEFVKECGRATARCVLSGVAFSAERLSKMYYKLERSFRCLLS